MGYTASKTQVMVGLGVSSISDSWYGFAQNVKAIEEYYQLLKENNDSLNINDHLQLRYIYVEQKQL